VDFAGVSEVASAITPVPGGVGVMTITMLLENTLRAAGSIKYSTTKHFSRQEYYSTLYEKNMPFFEAFLRAQFM